jgi:phage baseplate assembly protein W
MLSIKWNLNDSTALDLAQPVYLTYTARVGQRVPVELKWTVTEDDVQLPFQNVEATVDFNDGQSIITEALTPSPMVRTSRALLGVGAYSIDVVARNYRHPTRESRRGKFYVAVSPIGVSSTRPFLYGPVLPRDSGFPSASEWEMHTGQNEQMIESAVKLILTTKKGERMMEPDFGTRLHRILFEVDGAALDTLIREEITDALTKWEPRATLETFNITRPQPRAAKVEIMLRSKLTGDVFGFSTDFAR